MTSPTVEENGLSQGEIITCVWHVWEKVRGHSAQDLGNREMQAFSQELNSIRWTSCVWRVNCRYKLKCLNGRPTAWEYIRRQSEWPGVLVTFLSVVTRHLKKQLKGGRIYLSWGFRECNSSWKGRHESRQPHCGRAVPLELLTSWQKKQLEDKQT